MRDYFLSGSFEFKNEDPFRLELLSNAQMESLGVRIGAAHKIITTKQPDRVLKRLADNEEVIGRVQQLLSQSVQDKQALSPASEWFLDNLYLIKEQIDIARKHLPKGYSKTLPGLASGKSARLPRVYDIALEIIAHNDGRVDLENLTAFISGYQTKQLLTIGELWAIPIMLRFAIIENIRRIASRIAIDRIDKNEAINWADHFINIDQKNPREIIIATADMAKSDLNFNGAFVSEFTRRMQGKGQGLSMPLTWIEQQLAESGHSIAELVNIHNQHQAADQVSMRNSIESIRLLKSTDWKSFVESVSIVETILSRDPAAIYSKMDFETRDNYRHVVEWVAKKSSRPEFEIANMAIDLAAESRRSKKPLRQQHVGYFLIDKGKPQLIRDSGAQLSASDKFRHFLRKHRLFLYAGSTFIFALLISFGLFWHLLANSDTIWIPLLTGLLCFIVLGHFATIIMNWLATLMVRPKSLAKLDFSKGIPVGYSTMVAVPCLISQPEGIESLISDLEVRFLSNPQQHLFYCLLTDFADAPQEEMPMDQELLKLASEEIRQLNLKYRKPGESDRFFLLHRPRKWNPQEKVWMSYERKRGKLGALNNLLRHKEDKYFNHIEGKIGQLPAIKYVITLDADTLLPREAAWKMIATMAHLLNQPVIHPRKNIVVEGYGLIQPRTAVNLPERSSSIYAKMHSNDAGLDPYTQLVSDVYQDLFDEGSFIGKGIYDIDVFEDILGDTFPENRILSHDLLEGSYVRSALLTDVQLFEDYPETYWADVNRRHRWIRGDWQIASWGLPLAPDADNKLRKNPITALSRWKIWDNIKRSLMAPALLLLLLIIWLWLPQPVLWMIGLLVFWFFMPLVTTLMQLLHKPEEIDRASHLSDSLDAFKQSVADTLFNIVCLPFEAYSHAHAIFLANWRTLITKKKLLQWTPSAARQSARPKTLAGAYRFMCPAILITVAITILLAVFNPSVLPIAAPLLLAWLAGPAIAWRVSEPGRRTDFVIAAEDAAFLRRVSRKTWAFFEDFVGATDNYLPPDNYQEKPVEVTAHRSSPTNIGLSCLASLSALDFGYISLPNLTERLRLTFDALNAMERHRGHFYNWYDTTSLQPLYPRYISTVDSGNLISHMLVLRQGLLELPRQKIFSPAFYQGLTDSLQLAEQATETASGKSAFRNMETRLEALLHQSPQPIPLNAIGELLAEIATLQHNFSEPEASTARYWIDKMQVQLADMQQTLGRLLPWAGLLPLPTEAASLKILESIPSLEEIKLLPDHLQQDLKALQEQYPTGEVADWLTQLNAKLQQAAVAALQELSKIEKLANESAGFANVDYDFLYDREKHLFHIGYNVSDARTDKSYYDLLASEARLGIYTAIAQGKIPQDSWFALGRLITDDGTVPVLLSWSGSMFEYLMPDLVMPSYENTLLDKTARAVVQNQIDYGRRRRIPWGISESGYNLVDAHLNYQYQAFGVPGLGLKRGLGTDLVIAPYATMLALLPMPEQALDNLHQLAKNGFEGRYGFYEAVDFTSTRMPRAATQVIIRSYMAHHQGMSFLAMASLLLGPRMQERFEKDPQFQSALLLLKERVPKAGNYYTQDEETTSKLIAGHESHLRVINNPRTPVPEVQLLSNGRYHLAISNAGGGYSRWKDLAITRWREDGTKDNWGCFCYIRDLTTDRLWSNTYQPTREQQQVDEAILSQGHVEFRRVNEDFETRTDIVVSPEDDMELRQIKITNKSNIEKSLEVTGYCEVVIAPQAADQAHPAFSNLFVQTAFDQEVAALLCTRRARSRDEQPPWMFFMMLHHGGESKGISYESDRMQFIGRTRTLMRPRGVDQQGALSNTTGSVLDPVAAIKYQISLKPKQTARFEIIIGLAENEEKCRQLIHKYQDAHLRSRAFELSWTHSQVLLHQLNASETEAQLFNAMASHILYPNGTHRAEASIISSNQKGQSGLWGYSISGDLPIVLIRVQDSDNIALVKELVKAHAYWRLKGLAVDLVIWNDDFGSYRQLMHDQIMDYVAAISGTITDQPGAVFVKQGDQLSTEDRVLLQTVARLIFYDDAGSLKDQMLRQMKKRPLAPLLQPQSDKRYPTATPLQLPQDLVFNNGTGGFTRDGKEYFILNTPEQASPAPWVNLIANPHFGTMISESGSAYSWAENAHAYRLSPWKNDPVSDRSGEAFYIRDEATGHYWSPTPLPAKSDQHYITRNGFGYTVYQHNYNGIYSEVWVYVDVQDPIKFAVVKLRNLTKEARRLTVTGYVEWVLGDNPSNTRMYVVTEKDLESGLLFARNAYNSTFAERVSFFDADGEEKSFTCDREEFIGRCGSMTTPEALKREKLSNRYGAALDPCTAIQIGLHLEPEEEKEVVFRMGSEASESAARNLALKYKSAASAQQAQSRVHDEWNRILGAVYVETPDAALNFLTNGWLVYQTLACRVWGRSGFYQSGGAFGFRDQLQDVLALMHTRPDVTKAQILLAASRQFKEGDVQHWWHPPTGRGVRTKCSDDYLWLPYVTARYVEATGDQSILEEYVSYIEGRPLRPEEESYYDLPVFLNDWESIYNHCKRAIRHGLKFGEHGLPLIGYGDWNDGMDKVGEHGKGESVWLGFFLYDILNKFERIAEKQGDEEFLNECRAQAGTLKENIHKNGWDGAWYRRAYFDDGTPLGSTQNQECRIDSISQSWSVISGGGETGRSQQAMASLNEHLVDRENGIIKLLTPAFDKSELYPGYIKGYVPGVRENGGQYTHAAIWTIMAFAMMKQNERVWELFSMINPVHHTQNAEEARKYKVEPYVMAADVYGVAPHEGRGGWTWYTGSAGWTYQLGLEHILGLRRSGAALRLEPCVPESWPGFKVNYRFGNSFYQIQVERTNGEGQVRYSLDGQPLQEDHIPLTDDGQTHQVLVELS
ncbi:glucoamylase family protein [Niabella terrae]